MVALLAYIPGVDDIFHTSDLSLWEWLFLLVWPPLVLGAAELHKSRRPAQNGMTAMCGSNNLQCCATQQNCGSGNVAWHFFDGADNHYTGPSMFSTPQTANCSAYAGIDNTAYVRLSACKKY